MDLLIVRDTNSINDLYKRSSAYESTRYLRDKYLNAGSPVAGLEGLGKLGLLEGPGQERVQNYAKVINTRITLVHRKEFKYYIHTNSCVPP